MGEPIFVKGRRFEGPDGMGYELTQDVYRGDVILASTFKAYGGAPEPTSGAIMPKWLEDQLPYYNGETDYMNWLVSQRIK